MNLLLHPKMNFGVKSESPNKSPPAAVVKVHASCKQAYDELCNKHQHAYLIFRISNDDATILVEKKGAKDAPYSEFVDEMRKLIAEDGKHNRYAAVDVPTELKPAQIAEGITRISKVIFMQFFPDGKRNIIWTRTMVDKQDNREGREAQKKNRTLHSLGTALSKRAKSVGAALSRRHRYKSAPPTGDEPQDKGEEAEKTEADKQSLESKLEAEEEENMTPSESRHLLTVRRQNSTKKNSAGSLSVI